MRPEEQLQRQLEAANPVPPGAPLDPTFLARLRARIEEQTPVTNATDNRPTFTPAKGRPKWFPYTVVAGAAAAIALGVGVGLAATGDDDTPAASAPVTTVSPPTTGAPTTIGKVPAVVERPPDAGPAPEVMDPSMMMCMQFSAELLAPAPLAFDGVVTAIDGTNVTFEVSKWFRGGSGDILVTDGVYITGGDMTALIGGPQVEIGGRYLVAGDIYSDAVRPGACGMVQVYSEELAAVYAGAFAA